MGLIRYKKKWVRAVREGRQMGLSRWGLTKL